MTLGVVSTVWLERLLLQLGPSAEVLEPAELKSAGAKRLPGCSLVIRRRTT